MQFIIKEKIFNSFETRSSRSIHHKLKLESKNIQVKILYISKQSIYVTENAEVEKKRKRQKDKGRTKAETGGYKRERERERKFH